MRDDNYNKNDIYKKFDNKDNYKDTYKIEKINNFKFYENDKNVNKYENYSDKELEKLIANALRINRSNAVVRPAIVPTPTQTPFPTQTQVPIPAPVVVPAPTPVPTIVNAPLTPTPTEVKSGPSPMIQKFLEDTTSASISDKFRGWVLPNGQLVSQYNEYAGFGRQDHGALVRLFINGLQEHDSAKYDELMAIYDNYVSQNYNARDIQESFAVDALGWIQVSEFGTKRIISRQERWQDRLIAPFVIDFGYDLVSSANPNQGVCYNNNFSDLYGSVKEIITLGLERRYSAPISR